MCMSSAFQVKDGEDVFVADYIQRAELGDGCVKLTDIMGKETVVNGTVKTVDFVKNRILIEPA